VNNTLKQSITDNNQNKPQIILLNEQIDTQFFFCICLFKFSTYFELLSVHHQEIQLYQYDIWYMSLYAGLDGSAGGNIGGQYQKL